MESIAGPDALEIVARAIHNLCHSFIPGDPFLKHNIEDYSGTQFDGGGKVELKDGATEATTSLIGVIDSFCGGKPGTLERGQQQAENISGSPTTIAELYKKAFSNSNYTSEDANIDSTIRKIIIDADQTQLTAQQVKDVYSQRSGRKVTLPVIQASLGRLLEQGGITIERRALSVRNRRKVGFYAVAGSGEK
jgi:hypothetical protein